MTIHHPFRSLIKRRFETFSPRQLDLQRSEAAVLVPLVVEPEPSVLLTVRASHLNSHPGEVSFPGGMVEPEDSTIAEAALRETFEEVNLSKDRFDIVGHLSNTVSKNGVLVHSVVGLLETAEGNQGSPDEIAEVFTVPWQFFKQSEPDFQRVERHGLSFEIPHFHFEDKHIWGLTAMIILELMNVVEGTQWPLPHYSQVIKTQSVEEKT